MHLREEVKYLADGGPVYQETNLEAFIVEPWNTASAAIFMGIALYWLIKLKGNYQNYLFLSVSMVILGIGGFGGALYHGLRTSFLFLMMDVLPILGLGLAASAFLWSRLLKKPWKTVSVLSLFVIVHIVLHSLPDGNQDLLASLGYVNIGLMILIPLVGVLMKTKFRYGWFVIAALLFFALALTFRVMDFNEQLLYMGTHWLWHIFGALTAFVLTHYFYRLITLRNRAQRRGVDF